MFEANIIEAQIRETVKSLMNLPSEYQQCDYALLLDLLYDVCKGACVYSCKGKNLQGGGEKKFKGNIFFCGEFVGIFLHHLGKHFF